MHMVENYFNDRFLSFYSFFYNNVLCCLVLKSWGILIKYVCMYV